MYMNAASDLSLSPTHPSTHPHKQRHGVPYAWLNTMNNINKVYGSECESCIFVPSQVVKVADFGVARVKAQSGVMTAETGTYRWMAPEVIFSYYYH